MLSDEAWVSYISDEAEIKRKFIDFHPFLANFHGFNFLLCFLKKG